MTTTQITTAITEQAPIIAAIYAEAYRNAFDALTAWTERTGKPRNRAYGDQWMNGVAQMAGRVTSFVGGMYGTEYLDDAKVEKASTADATALVARYAAKVEAKAAGMTDVTVSAMDARGSFVITGTKAGRTVEIRQSMVTNCSSKGTWFAQFPALVYIDGKKSTEKALLAL